MTQLLHKINYRNIPLSHDTRSEQVPVKLKSGEYRFVPWLGFMQKAAAIAVKGTPVKIKVAAFSEEPFPPKWIDLSPEQHIQGCLVDRGVYAVIEGRRPRVV